MRTRLEENDDYSGEVRICFDRVLVDTFRFLDDRMNVILAGERFAYLRKADALEGALQEDYRQWMVGNGLQGVVNIEVSGVSSGRVDVRFAFGPHRLITEVKRDDAPFDAGALDKHLNQAGMYQASNARLGILLVLDLSDKSHGEMRSLENNVWVTTKPSIATWNAISRSWWCREIARLLRRRCAGERAVAPMRSRRRAPRRTTVIVRRATCRSRGSARYQPRQAETSSRHATSGL